MAVFAIPNPKKSTIVDFPIERIKLSVQNLGLVNSKYKFTKSNEIFNQYTYEALEFLSLGVFVDINLNSIDLNKTEITVEVRRKIGSFNQAHEVTKANEHLDKVFSSIANLTSKTSDEIEKLKSASKLNTKKEDLRPFYKKKRFIIPAVLILFGIIKSQIDKKNNSTEVYNSTETTTPKAELTQVQKDSVAAFEENLKKENDKVKKEWENSKAGKIQKKHPTWSDDDCEKVAKNNIWIGMQYEMLVYMRGKPNTVNTSNYGNGKSYQACWHDYDPGCFYFDEDQIIKSYN